MVVLITFVICRAIGRSENPGVGGGGASINLLGIICPPDEIGLNNLSKFGGFLAPGPSGSVAAEVL